MLAAVLPPVSDFSMGQLCERLTDTVVVPTATHNSKNRPLPRICGGLQHSTLYPGNDVGIHAVAFPFCENPIVLSSPIPVRNTKLTPQASPPRLHRRRQDHIKDNLESKSSGKHRLTSPRTPFSLLNCTKIWTSASMKEVLHGMVSCNKTRTTTTVVAQGGNNNKFNNFD